MDIMVLVVVILFVAVLFDTIGELLTLILIIVAIAFAIDYSNSTDYYSKCTAQEHSYVSCFYHHVLKP